MGPDWYCANHDGSDWLVPALPIIGDLYMQEMMVISKGEIHMKVRFRYFSAFRMELSRCAVALLVVSSIRFVKDRQRFCP